MSRFNVNDLFLDIRLQIDNIYGSGNVSVTDTYSDLGWVLAEVEHGSLTRKESSVSLPHANDVIDFSEYGGTAHYEPREIKYKFWRKGTSRSNMIISTKVLEELFRELSVNSRIDKVYDPTIRGNFTNIGGSYISDYWARPRCMSFEERYYPLSGIAEVSVTLRVYPLPQSDTD